MLCKALVNVRIQIRILFQFHFDRSWQRDFDFDVDFGNRQIDTLCTFFGLYPPPPPSLLAAQFEFVVVVIPLSPSPYLLRVLSCLRVLLLISREFRKRRSLA